MIHGAVWLFGLLAFLMLAWLGLALVAFTALQSLL